MNQTGPRYHAFDSLRGLMMWLGIVLHSAMVYMEPRNALHGSPQTSLAASLIFGWVHTFRMPVFFIMAGFFAALLMERRGLTGLLANRARRIGLPFLIFWPILLVLINVIILEHATRLDVQALDVDMDVRTWIISTGHLWFLYYLVLLTLVVAPLLCALQRAFASMNSFLPKPFVPALATTIPGLLVLSLPGAWLSKDFPFGIMSGNSSFLPDIESLVYYALFYLFGVTLYNFREELTAVYSARWPVFLAVSVALYLVCGLLGVAQLEAVGNEVSSAGIKTAFIIFYSFGGWTWSAFFLGFFSRFLNDRHPVAQYLSDSSYWVYLMHYPVVLSLALMMYDFELPALIKMSILIAVTTLTCLLTWQLGVRNSMVGALLNGGSKTAQNKQ